MGKQIIYYLDDLSTLNLYTLASEMGLTFLQQDPRSKHIQTFEICDSVIPSNGFFLMKNEVNGIVFNKRTGLIDDSATPVIQVQPTITDSRKKEIRAGRLWIQTSFYDNSGAKILADPILFSCYERLTKYVKKYVPYQNILIGENKEYTIKAYISNIVLEYAYQNNYRLI